MFSSNVSLSYSLYPLFCSNTGDIVGVGNPNADGKFTVITSGVVSSAHESYFTVALEKDSDSSDLDCDDVYSLIKLANDVTYKRLKRYLNSNYQKNYILFISLYSIVY